MPDIDPFSVPIDTTKEETNLQIKQLCIRLLPSWHNLSADELELTPISGGISNLLVKVTPSASHGIPPVAVKVFGNKTELLIDRDKELEMLLKLNSFGFGAKVLGMFSNGRIEEFLTAKTLTPQEMSHPRYVPSIAETLQRLHAVPTDGNPTLWPTIMKWFEMAQQLSFDDPAKQAQFSKVDFDAMRQEIEAIKSVCDLIPTAVVFSHNDLLSGNILIIEQQQSSAGVSISAAALGGDMNFIDYEYSACGYRGFDFGNHFNEYAGFECDYTRYPDSEAQHLFFRHYLASAAAVTSANGDSCTEARSSGSSDVSHEQLRRLEAEANVFALVSHVYWGVWALIQARYSPIDFDYLGYSGTRWQEYHRRKEEFVLQAKRVFG